MQTLIAIILVFASLFLIGTFSRLNIILLLSIWSIFIVYVINLKKPIKLYLKMIILISLFIIIIAYILIPKKITGCGVLSDGPICSSIMCIGIPYNLLTTPGCIGKYWPINP
ncbi:MAG: hypothetical protein ACD_7C00387G0003 [uncultured bacterium]|nr:MAG: hypothetical protein ACD_7C00387G0003 [uncultured bacterium]KKP68711.1 MAG: hypothetical protein UR66_C0004G0111 [Candidatus Moranbacteria bacterium GW2011_GWE1_35_17]KKP81398.1 MAG: hypothetical protein UR82_C0065G0005 [Candidatus Moranbacteria bacterium GW2011_GWF1_35_5]KKP84784.1 MAG: hypothetical protein UR83_C0012G0007 [Candidatus Moranbacteria bacterium GW2011_GWF2_35_54]HBR79189.1 hypothetical protein [Candidatus Moranbacteria bacterium]